MTLLEMHCLSCGEHFILPSLPEQVGLVEHQEHEDGTPCGSTLTELAGTWVDTNGSLYGGMIFVPVKGSGATFLPSQKNRYFLTGEPPPPERGGNAVGVGFLIMVVVISAALAFSYFTGVTL